MEFNREQIVKAAATLEGAKVMVANRDFSEFQDAIITALNALALIRELAEENERLRASCTELTQCCTKLETLYKVECKRVDTIKADTVLKMKEAVLKMFPYDKEYTAISRWTVNRIAKKMLEETNEH